MKSAASSTSNSQYPAPHSRLNDPALSWISRDLPQLESWRDLAIKYFNFRQRKPARKELQDFSNFLDGFLTQKGLPNTPEQVLHKDTILPDYYETACPQSRDGVLRNNRIHYFLEFVLKEIFGTLDPSTGKWSSNPKFHNPVRLRKTTGKKFGLVAIKSRRRLDDHTLSWIRQDFPELQRWQKLAVAWLKTLKRIRPDVLNAISLFLDRFLIQEGLPLEPEQVLHKDTTLPDFFERACPPSQGGALRNNLIRDFLAFVLTENFSTLDPTSGKKSLNPNYRNPVSRRNIRTFDIVPVRALGITKQYDQDLSWVKQDCPQIESWRALASEWIKGPGAKGGAIGSKLFAISEFLRRYIVGLGLPVAPARLLDRANLVPSFFETCCQDSPGGQRKNNHVHEFLEFVLMKECSEQDDFGRLVISPAFHNPIEWRNLGGRMARRTETNKVPLPFAYITRLRHKLIQGANFKDWVWAQNSLGAEIGKAGVVGPDWFTVTQDQLDLDDPDCVWRRRRTLHGEVLEMWSPVRWVALAFKLLVPLRTFQVRMLDSGEGDTWWYEAGDWVLNKGRLAQGRPGHSRHQGFLHRSLTQEGTITQLYANTNKTADIGKSGSARGLVFPWVTFGDVHGDVFYWAEKLRNWQAKYNPIKHLTSWRELDARHLPSAKSDAQLADCPDTAFLFRCPEKGPTERHLPVHDTSMNSCWFNLLEAFEEDLARAGETLRNGERIRFLPLEGDRKRCSTVTNHPLHSLRVSLITALAVDGKVPIEIMQMVVGHSRLLMTIYYVVPGETHIRLTMQEAQKRLEANPEASMQAFLLDTKFKDLLANAIPVDPEGIRAAIPEAPGDRNPVGWVMMSDGCCLMGANTSPIDECSAIGGCYNGGPIIGSKAKPKFTPVPGGPRNCIRCRWFVTMPHYLHALVARLNRLFYEKAKEQTLLLNLQQEKDSLEADRYDAIQAGVPFDRTHDLRAVDRQYETSISRFDVILGNIFACTNLIRRCEAALNKPIIGMGLVTVGSATEIRAQIEETDSELRQLCQVCDDIETYPDLLPAPDAVFRRSQILDMALMSEGYKPLFLTMTPEQQNLNANALMREMARLANPSDSLRGRVKVVTLVDLQMNLLDHLGFQMADCMPPGVLCEPLHSAASNKVKTPRRKNVIH